MDEFGAFPSWLSPSKDSLPIAQSVRAVTLMRESCTAEVSAIMSYSNRWHRAGDLAGMCKRNTREVLSALSKMVARGRVTTSKTGKNTTFKWVDRFDIEDDDED